MPFPRGVTQGSLRVMNLRRQASPRQSARPLLRTGIAALLLLATPLPAPAAGRSAFRVEEGVLLKDGVPVWAHGVNAPDLFSRVLEDPQNREYERAFDLLSRRGIPFVRFWIGFYPVHWRLYRDEPDEFFARLDRFVAAAEARGIALFPCLFWNPHAITDLLGARFESWDDERGAAQAFLRGFVAELGRRYGNSPAIWGVEMSNEAALGADLPNASEIYLAQGAIPSLGVRARTEEDFVTTRVLSSMKAAFAAAASAALPGALLSTGDAMPRESAWHNSHAGTFEPDSAAQFRLVLQRDHPKTYPLMSLHCYPGAPRGFDPVAEAAGVARRRGQAVFLGEWGVSSGTPRSEWEKLLQMIRSRRIQISAVWQYGLESQRDDWLITESNSRAFMLDDVGRLNASRPEIR